MTQPQTTVTIFCMLEAVGDTRDLYTLCWFTMASLMVWDSRTPFPTSVRHMVWVAETFSYSSLQVLALNERERQRDFRLEQKRRNQCLVLYVCLQQGDIRPLKTKVKEHTLRLAGYGECQGAWGLGGGGEGGGGRNKRKKNSKKKNNNRPNKFKEALNLQKHHDRSLLIGCTHIFPS